MFNGTSTQDRSICANCGRVKPTQLAKDGQRDAMHNSQYVTQCKTVRNKTLQLQECNNRLSNRMTYLLRYYVSAFTNTKSDHTLEWKNRLLDNKPWWALYSQYCIPPLTTFLAVHVLYYTKLQTLAFIFFIDAHKMYWTPSHLIRHVQSMSIRWGEEDGSSFRHVKTL